MAGAKVSEAKAAAAKLRAWRDAGGVYAEYCDELDLVLAHYAKLTAPKVSRKGRYVKGRAFEYEVRDHLNDNGLKCRRVAQSGGGVEKDDIVLETSWGQELRLECKRIAQVPAYLDNPQCAATVFRVNKGDTLVLMPLQLFTELCQ